MKQLAINLLTDGYVEINNSQIEEWRQFTRISGIQYNGGAITEKGKVFYIEY